ncbi:MAG: tetratricopeptide repeat protein [Alphaproteobacteria bacterium]
MINITTRRRIFPLLYTTLLLLAACSGNNSAPSTSLASADLKDMNRLMEMAARSEEKGDNNVAAGLYARANALHPQSLQPLLRLAVLFNKMENFEAAQKTWQAVLAIAPNHNEAIIGLGNALLQRGEAMAARDHFRKYVPPKQAKQNDSRIWSGLGIALDMLGQHKEAQASYQQAMASIGSNPMLVNNLAFSYLLSGQLEKAEQLLRPLCDSPNSSPTARYNLALALALQGKNEESRSVASIELGGKELDKNMLRYEALKARLAQSLTPPPAPVAASNKTNKSSKAGK